MSGYILCQTKKADKPFFVESINTNIYSLEELCYFLYHNLYLVDSSVINENLCIWISEELDLPRLAAKLRPHLGKFASAEDVLYPVFKEINYLTYDELKALNVKVYQQLLKKEGLEQIRPGLTMSVWHNLGCAYSYLFQMEKAMECFWEAFLTQSDPKELVCYLLAYRSVKKPQEYENRLKQLNVSEEVKDTLKKALDEFAQKKEVSIRPGKADEMLEKLTGEYHRSTGS